MSYRRWRGRGRSRTQQRQARQRQGGLRRNSGKGVVHTIRGFLRQDPRDPAETVRRVDGKIEQDTLPSSIAPERQRSAQSGHPTRRWQTIAKVNWDQSKPPLGTAAVRKYRTFARRVRKH